MNFPQDRFSPPGSLISVDRALAFLAERFSPVTAVERVAVVDAGRRVLAEDVAALAANPPADCAVMDGYAFAAADLSPAAGETALKVTARIPAGHPYPGTFGPGEAARIFTGAVMPAGLDTVAMQENCRTEGGTVYLGGPLPRGQWVRPAGRDFAAGSVVLGRGRRLRPQDVAMAAAAGHDTLLVHRRLRVGVFSTGDEVVEPGAAPGPGQVFGCNRQGILAMVRGLGCDADDLGNIPDRFEPTRDRLAEVADRYDLLMTSGGVSVGGEDHVRAAVEARGSIHLWRMALKPGKPTAFGHVGNAVFIGLPGNPVSCLVSCMMIARPVILRLAGAGEEAGRLWRFPVRAAFAYEKDDDRREFIRVSLGQGSDGRPAASLYRSQASSMLTSLVESDGLVDVPEATRRIAPGDLVDFIPYAALQW